MNYDEKNMNGDPPEPGIMNPDALLRLIGLQFKTEYANILLKFVICKSLDTGEYVV